MPIRKLLIANRGEIAVRINRAAKELGIATVQVHSKADKDSLAVRLADEAVDIGPPQAAKSYLNREAILAAAKATGADAIHPGYGFLAENAEFAAAVEAAGLIFVGPTAQSIRLMGDKVAARDAAAAAGVPTVPGSHGRLETPEAGYELVERIGYPVMIKAAAGGGGKGMRVCREEAELLNAMGQARVEAEAAFKDPSVYLEKYLDRPRHVEVQLMADSQGNCVHLWERDCSLQRRHQKLVEESPSPNISEKTRKRLCESAVRLAKQCGYVNAGTCEFLVDRDENFYFIEVNARIQVEHPVTELVTGIDLVKQQILIAAGEPLPFKQADVPQIGHAFECRINCEDPDHNFRPSPGKITDLRIPGGFGVRWDSHVRPGYSVPPNYDSMVGKLLAHGRDRNHAMAIMRRALDEIEVHGIATTVPLHRRFFRNPDFIEGRVDTTWVERVLMPAPPAAAKRP